MQSAGSNQSLRARLLKRALSELETAADGVLVRSAPSGAALDDEETELLLMVLEAAAESVRDQVPLPVDDDDRVKPLADRRHAKSDHRTRPRIEPQLRRIEDREDIISIIVASKAADEPLVVGFRRGVLKGKLLGWSDVDSWYQEQADGVVDELEDVIELLLVKSGIPWCAARTRYFILTGGIPRVPAVEAGLEAAGTEPAYRRRTLRTDPQATPDIVAEYMTRMRGAAAKKRAFTRTDAWNELALFLLERGAFFDSESNLRLMHVAWLARAIPAGQDPGYLTLPAFKVVVERTRRSFGVDAPPDDAPGESARDHVDPAAAAGAPLEKLFLWVAEHTHLLTLDLFRAAGAHAAGQRTGRT